MEGMHSPPLLTAPSYLVEEESKDVVGSNTAMIAEWKHKEEDAEYASLPSSSPPNVLLKELSEGLPPPVTNCTPSTPTPPDTEKQERGALLCRMKRSHHAYSDKSLDLLEKCKKQKIEIGGKAKDFSTRIKEAKKAKKAASHTLFDEASLPYLLRKPKGEREVIEFYKGLRKRLIVVESHQRRLLNERQALLGALWNLPLEIITKEFPYNTACCEDADSSSSINFGHLQSTKEEHATAKDSSDANNHADRNMSGINTEVAAPSLWSFCSGSFSTFNADILSKPIDNEATLVKLGDADSSSTLLDTSNELRYTQGEDTLPHLEVDSTVSIECIENEVEIEEETALHEAPPECCVSDSEAKVYVDPQNVANTHDTILLSELLTTDVSMHSNMEAPHCGDATTDLLLGDVDDEVQRYGEDGMELLLPQQTEEMQSHTAVQQSNNLCAIHSTIDVSMNGDATTQEESTGVERRRYDRTFEMDMMLPQLSLRERLAQRKVCNIQFNASTSAVTDVKQHNSMETPQRKEGRRRTKGGGGIKTNEMATSGDTAASSAFYAIDWTTLALPQLQEWMVFFGLKGSLGSISRNRVVAELQRISEYMKNSGREQPEALELKDSKDEATENMYIQIRSHITRNTKYYEKLLLSETINLSDVYTYLKNECLLKVSLKVVRQYLEAAGAQFSLQNTQ